MIPSPRLSYGKVYHPLSPRASIFVHGHEPFIGRSSSQGRSEAFRALQAYYQQAYWERTVRTPSHIVVGPFLWNKSLFSFLLVILARLRSHPDNMRLKLLRRWHLLCFSIIKCQALREETRVGSSSSRMASTPGLAQVGPSSRHILNVVEIYDDDNPTSRDVVKLSPRISLLINHSLEVGNFWTLSSVCNLQYCKIWNCPINTTFVSCVSIWVIVNMHKQRNSWYVLTAVLKPPK